jgi:MFS family permease
MSAISIVSVLSAFRLTGTTRKGVGPNISHAGFRAQGTLLKTNTGVQSAIILTAAAMFALGGYLSFLPVYLGSLQISATTIGALLSLRAFSAMVIRPFMPVLIDFAGGRKLTILLTLFLLAVGLALTGVTSGIIWLYICALLIGAGSGVSQPLSMVLLAESVTAEQRSSALAMRLMANRGVQLLAPLMLGLVAEATSFTTAFILGGIIVFIGIAVLMRCMR